MQEERYPDEPLEVRANARRPLQNLRQRGFFEAGQQYQVLVGQATFYGLLARHGYGHFDNEKFADLYCEDNGRPRVQPSLLAIALLLQAHSGISDEEARHVFLASIVADADRLLAIAGGGSTQCPSPVRTSGIFGRPPNSGEQLPLAT